MGLRRWRFLSGILLLALSVAGLLYWEAEGRNRVLMAEAVAATRDIEAGSAISADMLTVIQIPKESRIKNGFTAEEMSGLVGKTVSQPIYEKQQLSESAFVAAEDGLAAGESYFVIPAEWIAMRSSALRRGDHVEIAGADGGAANFGVYRLAFVKDADEGEVRDISLIGEIVQERRKRKDRTDSGSAIDHVEIIATAEAYFRIRAYASGKEGPSLILILHAD
jgi:hypothetical protein